MARKIHFHITVDLDSFRSAILCSRKLVIPLTLFLAIPLELGSENITLSTIYPSPVGIYSKLITTGGNISAVPQNTLLARDRGLVGIGTQNPQATLDVTGDVRVGNFNSSLGQPYPNPTPGGLIYDPSVAGGFLGSNGTGWSPLVSGSFGGFWETRNGACMVANWLTGACSCPPGYASHGSGALGNITPGWTQLYFCYK